MAIVATNEYYYSKSRKPIALITAAVAAKQCRVALYSNDDLLHHNLELLSWQLILQQC